SAAHHQRDNSSPKLQAIPTYPGCIHEAIMSNALEEALKKYTTNHDLEMITPSFSYADKTVQEASFFTGRSGENTSIENNLKKIAFNASGSSNSTEAAFLITSRLDG
ncbi:hypothetical protein, partial [Deinococcus alpinitundrae]|uniref:hypothetical protein n=1 Tax=Deinococcus alpinitundrae TaxID=468913 RepID=UPI001ED972CC